VVIGTLAEAVAHKEALIGTEDTKPRSRQRFGDYAANWIRENSEGWAPSTVLRYENALSHAIIEFGQYYTDSLEARNVRNWVKKMSSGYAAPTVNGWLRVLRQALDPAVEDGILNTNPARATKALREGRTKGKRGTALSVEEFGRLLEALEELSGTDIAEDVARLLKVVAWTGMRRGEVLALRWDDLVDDEIRVERSVWKRQEKTTKTDDPRRVALIEPLAEVLAEQRHWLISEQHPGLESGLVFPASPKHARTGATIRDGQISWFRSPAAMDGPLAKVVAAAKIPPISPHSLRRTWEDLLRRAGADQLVRRALSGWRTEKAQAIYATVNREERSAAASAVVDLVKGAKK